MNPLKRQKCNRLCEKHYCRYNHFTGKELPNPGVRKILEQRFGSTCCPQEWEISAVKK